MTPFVENKFMKNISRKLVSATVSTAALLLFGCTTTDQLKIKGASGFLGDYTDLKPGTDGEAALIFIDPSADFPRYRKIYIAPVALWKAEGDSSIAKISTEDQQLLVDYLASSLKDSLSSDYQIVAQPGNDTLTIRTALTEATKSSPVMNVLSKATPIGLGVTFTKKLVTGTHTGVGTVGVEAELVDGGTGKRVAAMVDRRAGGNSISASMDTWGDVKDIFDHWARRFKNRLGQLNNPSAKPASDA